MDKEERRKEEERRREEERREKGERRKKGDKRDKEQRRKESQRRTKISRRNKEKNTEKNSLINEIEILKRNFEDTTKKLIKDIVRQDKIMLRSDQRQRKDYDELQLKLEEIKLLSKEIEDTQVEVIFTMGAIGESRSKETGFHVKRVAEYSKLFALYYGLPLKEAEMLKQASPMHDIGKVAIPDMILNKPGRFTDEERVIMDTHAQIGYDMLRHSNRILLKTASTVAYEHHEKYNGKGYPQGLKGEEIHIYGRITALADVFDALGSDRVYKKAWEDERIFKLFREERGEHFDPKLIDIFFENLDEFLTIRSTFKDMLD